VAVAGSPQFLVARETTNLTLQHPP